MLGDVPSLTRLLKLLQQVPYLASKSLYRTSNYFLSMDHDRLDQFCAVLRDARSQLIACSTCNYWQERNAPCVICLSPARDQHIICVVETWYDLLAIERTRAYRGTYHVLGGAICPLEGIGPEDLSIEMLINRIQDNAQEVILALSQTPEGEATASFIANKIKGKNGALKITCLARGMPVGSSLGAMDRVTIHKALSERRPF